MSVGLFLCVVRLYALFMLPCLQLLLADCRQQCGEGGEEDVDDNAPSVFLFGAHFFFNFSFFNFQFSFFNSQFLSVPSSVILLAM